MRWRATTKLLTDLSLRQRAFSYYGAKSKLIHLYPTPTHVLIMEPFAGSAAYAQRYHDRDVLLYDVNPRVVAAWSWLIGATKNDVLALPATVRSLDDHALSPGERALFSFLLAKADFGQGQRTRPSPWCTWGRERRYALAKFASRIKHWIVRCESYTSAPDIEATWFIDPPYQHGGGALCRRPRLRLRVVSALGTCETRSSHALRECEANMVAREYPHNCVDPEHNTQQTKHRGNRMDPRLEYVALDAFEPWPDNPKQHDVEAIKDSIRRFGFVQPLLVDENTGRLVAGHGRLEALLELQAAGEASPMHVRVEKRRWLVPTVRGVGFVSEIEAGAYLIADNRLVEVGGWDPEQLVPLLVALGGELDGVGFDDEDLERFERMLAGTDNVKAVSFDASETRTCPHCGKTLP